MEQDLDLGRYFGIIRRRYLYFILPAAIIFAVTVLVAYLLPRSYEATATILIESQRIPSELATSTVTASPSERIKVIEQRLLARDNLLEIARKFALYGENGAIPSPSEIVDSMRGAIAIEQIDVSKQSRRNADIVGFSVAFQYANARISARVTNELVTKILSQNVETRLSRATETSDFFQQQLTDIEARLLAAENKMASFKRDNEAILPETLDDRRTKLTQFTEKLAAVDQALRLAENPDAFPAAGENSKAQQLNYSLQSAQLNYNALLERRDLLTPLAKKGYVTKTSMLDLDKQIALAEIEIESIKSQMAQQGISADPDAQINMLKEQRETLSAKVDALKKSISMTPAVEVEYGSIKRNYENLQTEYNQIKAKLREAQTGERLEQDRQAERFEVLEQATVPEKATKPDRTKIILAGGVGAGAFGLGLVLLLELLDNSIRTSGDLERRLQLRPIAVIPYIETADDQRRRTKHRLGLAAIVAFVFIAAITAIHFYYLPLDLLAERGWQKIEVQLSGLRT